mgnify:CR=1 FL=1
MTSFVLAVIAWAVIPFNDGWVVADLNVAILYIFAIGSLEVYGVIMGGWASNSKYPFLGSLRSAAQMISYEVSIGFIIVGVIMAAIYILYMFQKMFLGPLDKEENMALKDINWREIVTLVPLLIVKPWSAAVVIIEGIITYLLLIRAGFKQKTSLLLAFFAAALTTPLGMIVSYPFISRIDKSVLGALLAFSAGALVYVGATHLLPQAETEHKRYSILALAAGILVALVIIFSKG